MKNHLFHFPLLWELIRHIRRFLRQVWWDRVSVYAAQASFFLVISAVPLVSMLVNIIRIFCPTITRDIVLTFFTGTVPNSFLEMGVLLFDDAAASVPVLSVSALFVWWSAAKGVGAIREGLQTVYETPRKRGYFRKMFASILYTILFVLLIVLVVGTLLFGELLLGLLSRQLPQMDLLFHRLMAFKTPFFLVLLSLVFALFYKVISRENPRLSNRWRDHLPGAVCSSLGWLVFSFGYSYYMNHATRPQMLYGSLTGLCLILLWLYFCMIILLWGGEINKLYFANRTPQSIGKTPDNRK